MDESDKMLDDMANMTEKIIEHETLARYYRDERAKLALKIRQFEPDITYERLADVFGVGNPSSVYREVKRAERMERLTTKLTPSEVIEKEKNPDWVSDEELEEFMKKLKEG